MKPLVGKGPFLNLEMCRSRRLQGFYLTHTAISDLSWKVRTLYVCAEEKREVVKNGLMRRPQRDASWEDSCFVVRPSSLPRIFAV